MTSLKGYAASIGIAVITLTAATTASAGCSSGGDHPIDFFVDNNGAVTFEVNVNGDVFGSTHQGTVTCDRPVSIVSQQHRDGGCHFDGLVNGGIYTWHTQCGAT